MKADTDDHENGDFELTNRRIILTAGTCFFFLGFLSGVYFIVIYYLPPTIAPGGFGIWVKDGKVTEWLTTIIATISAAISLTAVILVARTLKSTQQMVKSTNEALTATQESVSATKEMHKIQDSIFEEDYRPHVALRTPHFRIENGAIIVDFKVENIGRTAARSLVFFAMDGAETDEPDLENSIGHRPLDILTNSKRRRISFPIEDDDENPIYPDTMTIYGAYKGRTKAFYWTIPKTIKITRKEDGSLHFEPIVNKSFFS